MCLSALCEGWETLISLRLVASLEKKALLELVDGKPFSGRVSTQHFFTLNHFCFGLAALWLSRGLKIVKKPAFKALSQSGFLSLIEKLLLLFRLSVPCSHGSSCQKSVTRPRLFQRWVPFQRIELVALFLFFWRSALLRLYFQCLSNFSNTSNSSVAFSKGGCSVPWTGAMNLFSEPLPVFALLPGSCLCITVPSTCCFQDRGSRVGRCLWWWIFGLNPLPKQRSTSWA